MIVGGWESRTAVLAKLVLFPLSLCAHAFRRAHLSARAWPHCALLHAGMRDERSADVGVA